MTFSLEILDENKVKEDVVQETQVVSAEAAKIRQQAEENAVAVINCDMESFAAKKQLVASIEQFGLETMQKSSQKNSLLKVSVGKLSQTSSEGSEVSRGLIDLNREIKNLDPSAIDFSKSGLLGKMLNPIRAYFAKYEKAENVIANIVDSLDLGKKTLTNDNTTLAIEQQSLRELSKKLNKDLEMAAAMDALISEKIEEAQINNMDEDKIRFIQEEILFPLRQRTMDMQQMIVVNQQGILAMEIIGRNNKELIRGVDRAKTVTVTALRTAVMVASALYNQKIVLEKIQILNETTNNMIAATSTMLKQQGTEIHKQSIESNISVDTLKAAFRDVMDAIDEINTFKQRALPKMQATIEQFRELADKGEAAIQKIEQGNALMEK
jgi:uncharacterized protein YaaN involved in tellurite resistance